MAHTALPQVRERPRSSSEHSRQGTVGFTSALFVVDAGPAPSFPDRSASTSGAIRLHEEGDFDRTRVLNEDDERWAELLSVIEKKNTVDMLLSQS